MKSAEVGRRAELRSIAVLEAAGYYCVRSHMSKGIWDIVGISATGVVLVQVKTGRWPSEVEQEALREFKVPANCIKLLHRWRHGVSVPDVRVLP